MDGSGSLLADFACGDNAPTEELAPGQSLLKRDQDSTDDFEHLDREPKRDEPGESPLHHHGAARTATQSFLDIEREELVGPPTVSSATEKIVDHFADKFTDSESEPGDSPLHRLQPTAASESQPSAPSAPASPELSPVSPASAPPPVSPAAEVPKVTREPTPEPAPTPAYVPQPTPPPPPKPEPTPQLEAPRTPSAHVIEAEVIFRQMGLVESIIYWRDPARSGAALGGGLALLVALACCSVVSVAAYGALLALSAATAYRLYRNVLQAVHKTNDGHPFKSWLERDVSVPAERAQAVAAAGTAHLNAALHELRRLFLVEDLVDSVKFGVLLWCLTYVGACFNGITLIILGWVALFTLPKAYEMNKAQVDANLELARQKINEITAKVRAAVPLGRKSESDKDK